MRFIPVIAVIAIGALLWFCLSAGRAQAPVDQQVSAEQSATPASGAEQKAMADEKAKKQTDEMGEAVEDADANDADAAQAEKVDADNPASSSAGCSSASKSDEDEDAGQTKSAPVKRFG